MSVNRARRDWADSACSHRWRRLTAGAALLLAAFAATADGDTNRDQRGVAAPLWQQQDLWPDRSAPTDWPERGGRDWQRSRPERAPEPARQQGYRFRGSQPERDQGRSGAGIYGGWRFRDDPELEALTEPSATSGYRFRPPTERERRRWRDREGEDGAGAYQWRPVQPERLPAREDQPTFGYDR